MAFPDHDVYWIDTCTFLQSHIYPEDAVLAPAEFAEKLPGVFDYARADAAENTRIRWLVVHKGRMKDIDRDFLSQFAQEAVPVFANEVFVILSRHHDPDTALDPTHIIPLWKHLEFVNKTRRLYALSQFIQHRVWFFLKFLRELRPLRGTGRVRYQSRLASHIQRTNERQQPEIHFMNERLLFTADAVRLNIKTLGYEYARSLRDTLVIPENLRPEKINLTSKACQQSDIESNWFLYWCQQMHTPAVYHRKIWEFCYILQALYEHDLLRPGRKGLGFGCGEEPLPSLLAAYDIAITATDLDPEASAARGWAETNQSMSSLEKIWHPWLCTRALFDKNVRLQYIDMNALPVTLEHTYDFCWSSCALEHLGSIQKGLQFVENSLNTLVPGGVSVHTTEFNYLEEEETIDNHSTVLFRKRDFEELAERLTAAKHEVALLNFHTGSGFLDRFIDLPPYDSRVHDYTQEAHLKLLIDGFASTSFGLIIKKSS